MTYEQFCNHMQLLIEFEKLVDEYGAFFDIEEASPTYIVNRAFTKAEKKEHGGHRALVHHARAWRADFTSGP